MRGFMTLAIVTAICLIFSGTVASTETLPQQVARLESEITALRQKLDKVVEAKAEKGQAGEQGPPGPRSEKGASVSERALSVPGISFSEGRIQLNDTKGNLLLAAAANEQGGGLSTFDKSGHSKDSLFSSTDGIGHLWLGEFEGPGSIAMSGGESAKNGASASLRNKNGKQIVWFGGGGEGAGDIEVFDASGVMTALIRGGKDTFGGFSVFKNHAGQNVAYVGSASAGFGFMKLYTPEGKTVVAISATSSSSGETGGWARFYNNEGKEGIYIGISKAGTGYLEINGNQVHDYSEVFDLATRHGVEPGTVMAVTGSGGSIAPSAAPYDKRVVGVISGAGGLQPGAVVGSREDGNHDLPLAVSGQVYVRVCLEGGPIAPGDLLVASSRPGVAMRVAEPERAAGAVVGKALEPFGAGPNTEGLVRMMVMLR